MANPMQRRSNNAFLLGFLIATLLMAIVVGFLIYKMSGIKEEKEALEGLQSEVLVAAIDLDSGTELTDVSLTLETVRTTVDETKIIDSSIFDVKKGDIATDNEALSVAEANKPVVYKMKVAVPAGTIITKDMIYIDGQETTNDERLQEYNMIVLPSQLKNGDHVDIRFKLPSGQDYIVLSKKQIVATNKETIWIKVNEDEILTLNNAIVEAWTITGSKLYAIEYTEPGLQVGAVRTYPISADILNQINNSPNIVEEAKQALRQRYTDSQVNERNNSINSVLQQYVEDRNDLVEDGTTAEIQKMQELREEYVTSLEGTEEIGFTEE